MKKISPGKIVPLLLLPLSVACSSDDAEKKDPTSEKYLGLEQPEDGFQIRNLGRDIGPGEDVEYCEVGELPGDPSETYYVNRIEFANGNASHHLILEAAAAGTDAAQNLADAKIGDQVACISASGAFGDGFENVGGIQRPYGETAFPEGVGRVYHGGQRVVFDFHYYNTTTETIEARSAVNFHLTDEASIQHIARPFGFYNWTIDTPANSQASFTGECKFKEDVTISSLVRHTHRWGTDYEVWFAGGERDGEHIWTSHDFQEETSFPFEAPFVMKAGEGFRFRCDYDNTEDYALRFGVNATDEMCILFGLIWEAEDGQTLESQDCRITQIGDDGVARPAADDGGFRPPTSEERDQCIAGSADTSRSEVCNDCACGSCGGVLADCQNDVDCAAILECVQGSGCSGADCAQTCSTTISDHSSGTGLVIQVSDCLSQTCADVCSFD
jgi:hypothetical protein